MAQVESVMRVSEAAANICAWVHSMNEYHNCIKDIRPKEAMLAEVCLASVKQ